MMYLDAYLARGWQPLPIPHAQKKPAFDNWTKYQFNPDDFLPPSNVGILLGSPSGDLVDVDLDCPEAVALADDFLPPTPTLTFGRPGNPRSHRLYTCETKSVAYVVKKSEDDKMLLEIRSTGAQTVFPPSIHVSYEQIEWDFTTTDLARVSAPTLCLATDRLAAATLLSRAWPKAGRHAAQLALAGALLTAGIPDTDALYFLCAVCRVAGDENAPKRRITIDTTRRKIEAGEAVTSWGELASFLGPAQIRKLKLWLGAEPPGIIVSCDISKNADAGIEAIADSVYQTGSRLTRVRSGKVEDVTLPSLKETLSLATNWYVISGKDAERKRTKPPDDVVRAIAARGQWQHIPRLGIVTTTPTFRADGTLVTVPGYDKQAEMYYQPSYPAAPIPSLTEAVASIYDLITDFPFERDEHISAFVCMLLTPACRRMFDGSSPLFLVDATAAGSGKGMLARLAALLATSKEPPTEQFTGDDDNFAKVITTHVSAGTRILLLDNVTGTLGGAPLLTVLTMPEWSGRKLGENVDLTGPVNTTFYATANAATLGPDMDRRVCLIRLAPSVERPELRNDFRYPNLLQHVKANIAYYTACTLALMHHYVAAGRPPQAYQAWGSYEAWTETVLAAVRFAGFPDIGPLRERTYERADNFDAMRELFQAVKAATDAKGPLPAKELWADHKVLIAAKEYAKVKSDYSAIALGKLLSGLESKIVGGLRMCREERGAKQKAYYVE